MALPYRGFDGAGLDGRKPIRKAEINGEAREIWRKCGLVGWLVACLVGCLVGWLGGWFKCLFFLMFVFLVGGEVVLVFLFCFGGGVDWVVGLLVFLLVDVGWLVGRWVFSVGWCLICDCWRIGVLVLRLFVLSKGFVPAPFTEKQYQDSNAMATQDC